MYYTVQSNGAKKCQCSSNPIGMWQSPASGSSTCATGVATAYKRNAEYTFSNVCTDIPNTLGYRTVLNTLAQTADQCFQTCSAGKYEYALYNPRLSLLSTLHCICASGYRTGLKSRCDADTYYVYGLGARSVSSTASSASSTAPTSSVASATASPASTTAAPESTPAPRPPPTPPTNDDSTDAEAPVPSGARRKRDVRPKTVNETYCMKGLTACAIPGTSDWECVDPQHDLESCGGCAFGNFGGASAAMGVDCSSLPGVKSTGVQCSWGRCVIIACRKGYSLELGHCVPSN